MTGVIEVLHIITDLQTGGAEHMLKRLAAEPAVGIRHRVISLRGMGTVGQEMRAAGIEVQVLNLNQLVHFVSGFHRLTAMIRACSPDVVQTWLYHADLIGGLAAKAARVPRILWNVRVADIETETVLSRSAKLAARACARLSSWLPDRIVYVAEAARLVHEAIGYDPTKSVVIRNGYHSPPLATRRSARAHIRTELGVNDDILLIGTAGSFSARKNQVGFVAACAEIAADHPHVRFVLIGRGSTADNDVMRAAIARTTCGDRFHLLGERADIGSCLAALDVFCLASRGEGMPNVVGEAMANGTPCIVTDVGDAAFLVGQTGIVIRPDDPAALRVALLTSVSCGPAGRSARGARARARITRHFSMKVIKDQYTELYRSLAGGRSQEVSNQCAA